MMVTVTDSGNVDGDSNDGDGSGCCDDGGRDDDSDGNSGDVGADEMLMVMGVVVRRRLTHTHPSGMYWEN